MKGQFLVSSNEDPAEGNIYADKSALILDWLLREGIKRQGFSLRQVAKETEVSVGLVQRVFGILILKGLLQTEGIRTGKKFFFMKPKLLLASWLEHYSITKKCKMRTYHTAFSEKEELFDALKKSNLSQKVALALHSAAQAHGCKNTNLNSLELYLLDPTVRANLEDVLQLEPQERGYEVLLIEPYYESLLSLGVDSGLDLKICPALLTFLDLYHFPLRGQEQAEFMAERVPELKRIYKKN
ncbi:MAG: type IV toxin-antitoxin system AbiEi family antitoxin [Waddliaceae bacterium]